MQATGLVFIESVVTVVLKGTRDGVHDVVTYGAI